MDRAELLALLESAASLRSFVRDTLLTPVPWIFDGDAEAHSAWRTRAAAEARVEARHVYLVGSAATGYSLSPLKAGRPFKRRSAEHPYASDIDIVIVNQGLFMQMWNVLLNFDRTRRLVPLLPRPEADRTRPIDKLRADVYWGTVQHRLTPAGTEGARRVRLLLGTTTRELPFLGYVAKARVYRRVEDLEAYHEQSARQLAHALRQEQR